MIFIMQDLFLTNEPIFFLKNNGSFLTRLGNAEVAVNYNDTHWFVNWWLYETVIKCSADWWCTMEDCDLDDLKYEEYCPRCPRVLTEQAVSDASSSSEHTFIKNPRNIEEVRKNILHEYQKLSHNGLHNKDFSRIMHGTWVLK